MQLDLFATFVEDQLFTAAIQLMRQIYDDVVDGGEQAVHGDLPSAIDDLTLGPWHELDERLPAEWPYAMKCSQLNWLLSRLESLASTPSATEAVVTARWLLRPGSSPLWAHG